MICVEGLLDYWKYILGMDRNVAFFKYSHICNCNISRELPLIPILSDRDQLNVLEYPTHNDADYPTFLYRAIADLNLEAITLPITQIG